MFTKHSSGTIAVIFIAPVLLAGGLISLPTLQTVQATVDVDIGHTRHSDQYMRILSYSRYVY